MISDATIQELIYWTQKATSNTAGTKRVHEDILTKSGIAILDKLVKEVKEVDTPISIVYVTQANKDTTLGGIIDSTKLYWLDGLINMGATYVTVPIGGINLGGATFGISGLVSDEDNYAIFRSESPEIGSGDILGMNFLLSASGVNSKVYDLYDSDGTHAHEVTRVNYINCTSLGDLHGYRQGLEEGTGRFGGSPFLTLHGDWAGGFRVTTSITRGLDAGMTEPLFKEGTAFSMESRFLTDMNVDLPALAAFTDFDGIHFPNPSTIQFKGMEVTRDGVYDAEDTNITPNLTAGQVACEWKGNNGIPNTYVGGTLTVLTEVETVVTDPDTWYPMNATWLALDLQHFDQPSSGQLRHLGASPREFEISMSCVTDGTPVDELGIKFRKWDDSEGIFNELLYTTQIRQINNFAGGNDNAVFFNLIGVTLDSNDYIYMEGKNVLDNNNFTNEAGSFWRIQER